MKAGWRLFTTRLKMFPPAYYQSIFDSIILLDLSKYNLLTCTLLDFAPT